MIVSAISLLNIGRGVIGLATLIGIAYLFSNNRKAVNWSLVAKGIAIQIIFAIGVLKVDFVAHFFEAVSHGFVKIISFTDEGVNFLFKSFVTGKIENGLINFVIKILPTVIFFSALTSLFYYWGILQKIVYVFAWVMKKAMRLSGAESLAAAGNIFLGQTEAPLLVKPYIDRMTKSEIMCLMSGGMATIAGGVLAAYIGFLGGDSQAEQIMFAKHLLAASVMSAPAAVVAAKIIVPETEKFDTTLHISKEKIGDNALEAITNGTGQGLQLAVNVAGMLLVFIALIAMVNSLLSDVIGHYTGLNDWVASHTDYKEFSLSNLINLKILNLLY